MLEAAPAAPAAAVAAAMVDSAVLASAWPLLGTAGEEGNLEEDLLAVVVHTIQTLGEVVDAAFGRDQVATFDFALAVAVAAAVVQEGRLVHLS